MKFFKEIFAIFLAVCLIVVNGCEEGNDLLLSPSVLSGIDSDVTNPISIHREYNPRTQIIILYEGDYGKAVCREADPTLKEENFEVWNYPTHPDTVFRTVYERYCDKPLKDWPVICIPTANFEAINNLLLTDLRYTNMAVVMPYIKNGSWYTNTLNFFPVSKNFIPVLVGAGNQRHDWTKGNKLDFTDSVNIQYLNPVPQYNYVIENIENTLVRTRVWSNMLSSHATLGSQVWLSLTGSTGSIYNRFCVTEKGPGYIDIYQVNIGTFISGTAHVNFLSGAVFSVGAKLNGLMRQSGVKSFQKIVKEAKASASNNGIRNDSTGYGYINFKPDLNGSR